MNDKEKIDTDYVGHHISSGGFIFYKSKDAGEIFTLLITNKKNELWICKGHIEKNEEPLDAAMREFEEEMGIKKDMLTHVGLLTNVSYSFNEWGGDNTKEVYIHVFESDKMYDLSGNSGVEDITKIEWYSVDNALKNITFNPTELENGISMFKRYLNEK